MSVYKFYKVSTVVDLIFNTGHRTGKFHLEILMNRGY